MQCKDKIVVWTGIVTQGVEASDLLTYTSSENKELPVVLTKPGGSSSSQDQHGRNLLDVQAGGRHAMGSNGVLTEGSGHGRMNMYCV